MVVEDGECSDNCCGDCEEVVEELCGVYWNVEVMFGDVVIEICG